MPKERMWWLVFVPLFPSFHECQRGRPTGFKCFHVHGSPHAPALLATCRIYQILEKHYRDMQDIEFTIEKGRLWILQTRSGQRTAQAAVRIAVDMVKESLITEKEALLRVDPQSLEQLLHPRLDPGVDKTLLAEGLPASPGGVGGCVVFSSQEAVAWSREGKKVILVREETSPEDIEGMVSSEGILTSRGGMTSHAAVVARGMESAVLWVVLMSKSIVLKNRFILAPTTFRRGLDHSRWFHGQGFFRPSENHSTAS